MRLLDRINRTGTTVVMATRGIVDTMRRPWSSLPPGRSCRPRPGVLVSTAPSREQLLMAVNLSYVARETVSNLRRNLSMASAARRRWWCRSPSSVVPCS